MKIQPDDEGIIRYLLGISDHAEQALIEERLLRDTDFYQELLMAEDELVDQYLANELSEAQQEQFDKNFLVSAERMQKLRFARNLRRYATESVDSRSSEVLDPEPIEQPDVQVKAWKTPPQWGFLSLQNPVARYALAAAVILTFGSVVWFAIKSTQSTSPNGGRVLAITLTPGLTRETGEMVNIHIPRDVNVLRLRLAVPTDEYQSYRAELITEGRTVLVEEDLKAELAGDKFVILNIDARRLNVGDYQVKLSGRLPNQEYERLQGYQFRIPADDTPR